MSLSESAPLNLNLSPIVFVQLPADELGALLLAFAPEADWVIATGTGKYSAFGWDHPSGPGDEAMAVEYLASKGVGEAVVLWPDHWGEGHMLVKYEAGKRVSEEEVLSALEVAAELGVAIIA